MGDNIHINITGSELKDSIVVQNNKKYGASPAADEKNGEIIGEIKEVRQKLEDTERSLAKLEQAIRKGDKKGAGELIKSLSSGFAVSILANCASAPLLALLGI